MKKSCFKCDARKDISEFYKHKGMADGHLNKCKECAKSDVRKHRMDNLKVQEYDRVRYHKDPKRRARIARNAKKWNRENPLGYKAHNTIRNAVRDGRATKPNSCSICGDSERKLHAHHDDYEKPLDVEWLCVVCHGRKHAYLRNIENNT